MNSIKKALFTSQEALDVRGDELLHVGWKDEGFVSDVNDDVFDDCCCNFCEGVDCKIKWKF